MANSYTIFLIGKWGRTLVQADTDSKARQGLNAWRLSSTDDSIAIHRCDNDNDPIPTNFLNPSRSDKYRVCLWLSERRAPFITYYNDRDSASEFVRAWVSDGVKSFKAASISPPTPQVIEANESESVPQLNQDATILSKAMIELSAKLREAVIIVDNAIWSARRILEDVKS